MNSTGTGHTERQWQGKFFRCNMECYYCRVPLTLIAEPGSTIEQAEKDHKTPLSRGGSDAIGNIVPACRHCNRIKGTLTEEEFRQERRLFSTKERESSPMSFLPTETTGEGEISALSPSGECDHGIVACLSCGKAQERPAEPIGPRPVSEIEQLRAVERERNSISWWTNPTDKLRRQA